MVIKKTETGRWQVDVQPGGRGAKRVKKTFDNKAEATQWEIYVKSSVNKDAEWMPEKKDMRKLSELINFWNKHHGKNLKAGDDTYSRLLNMAVYLKDPIASNFKASDFLTYREERIEAGVSKNTMNHEHAYLRSVFNELIRVGEWKKENPLKKIRQFKIDEKELSFLTADDISKLFEELKNSSNDSTLLVTKICLATGARWNEAESLTPAKVKKGLIEIGTKSGKIRGIPISRELEAEIRATKPLENGRYFKSCYGAFRKATTRADIKLPEGQLSHVLRHTFASYFMQQGGSILTLQRVLGHSSLAMTMKYAHLAPDHLQDVLRLNPFNQLIELDKPIELQNG